MTLRKVLFIGLAVLLSMSLMDLIPNEAMAQSDIEAHPSCVYCGMDRAKFAHSRILISYDDGSTQGTCSLHCAALDMAVNLSKGPVGIQVGDFRTHKLVDVEKASWVIGGDEMGVMTKRAKWAFENKADAETFIQEHGGTLAVFEDALKAAYEDMYQDTKMIREKRKMMHQKKMESKGSS